MYREESKPLRGDMTTAKPCPFCSGPAELVHVRVAIQDDRGDETKAWHEWRISVRHKPDCILQGVELPVAKDRPGHLLDMWNRRAAGGEEKGLHAALMALYRSLEFEAAMCGGNERGDGIRFATAAIREVLDG